MKRKGIGLSLRTVILIILFLVVMLAVVPMITSGADAARNAATSCPAWMSSIRDLSGLSTLC